MKYVKSKFPRQEHVKIHPGIKTLERKYLGAVWCFVAHASMHSSRDFAAASNSVCVEVTLSPNPTTGLKRKGKKGTSQKDWNIIKLGMESVAEFLPYMGGGGPNMTKKSLKKSKIPNFAATFRRLDGLPGRF